MRNIEKVLALVRRLNIIYDVLFQKMAEDRDFSQEMISTILGRKITVKTIIPQNSIKDLQGRSVKLDALCMTDED